MLRMRGRFRLGGYLTFSTPRNLSGVYIQTPLGKISAVNNNRLAYEHCVRVTAGDSVGRNFYFLRSEKGLDEVSGVVDMLGQMNLRPAIMSEAFSLANLPFRDIRKAAIQTVQATDDPRQFASFNSKICLLCAGSDMLIDGEWKLNAFMVREDQVPDVAVNAINSDHLVHHKVCIPVTDDVFGRWPPEPENMG